MTDTDPIPPRRVLPSIGVGAVAAVLGLLPWVVTGMRLPLQNLWGTDTTAMPFALLPFSQYALTLIVAVLVTGWALAGLAARLGRARGVHPGAAALGVAVVQLIALVQTALVVAGGLAEGTASDVYLAALVSGSVAAIAVGAVVLLLIATAPRPGAAIGISLAAVAAGSWVTGLVAPLSSGGTGVDLTLLDLVQWLPGILAGLGLAWCGLTSVGRVAAWAVSLAALWIGPTLFTAVSAAAGSRVLAQYPLEMLDYGQQVFRTALLLPAVSLRTPITALVVGAVGFVVLSAVERRRGRVGD
ncbi:hypothetical protein NB037_18650 [Rathayibacter sp. ZW T2_19]|uniref:Uncharacterized protein n=1 Tax=Rathayibacter rubneri TaxID=2950106 RepID=A0A9X2E166_9MICO|nr:hypothetical protein [Rathayibacter rubneri]MCM6764438.1 hypothetical protein [Rathayibacter rubneri]